MEYTGRGFKTLMKTIYYAFKDVPSLRYSISGNQNDNESNESNLSNWDFSSGVETFSNIFIPSLPFQSPSWLPKPLKHIIFRGDSRLIPSKLQRMNKKYFIFVNGILTPESLIEVNRKFLEDIFYEPFDILHNASDSLPVDLIESAIGKQYTKLSEPGYVLFTALARKILDPNVDKVVVIAHSQGTIITSNVLKALADCGINHNQKEHLKKLEIYMVANCSSDTKYIDQDNQLPYIENISNRGDFVPYLGSLSRLNFPIDGKHIISEKKGHMFNKSYFNNFRNEMQNSKLYNYLPNINNSCINDVEIGVSQFSYEEEDLEIPIIDIDDAEVELGSNIR